VVQTQAVGPIRIVRQANQTQPFPTCSTTAQYEGIDGWAASFQFLRTSGVKVSQQGQDIDYGKRSYYVDTKDGPKGIRHGSGPMWGFGTPLESDV
jgi:hypothetical protein